jgi:hypothetical protein
MKMQREKFFRPTKRDLGAPARNEGGSVVFILITLLAIMLILVAANSRALLDLHRQTKLLEHRQVERLNASQTNTTDNVTLPAKLESK